MFVKEMCFKKHFSYFMSVLFRLPHNLCVLWTRGSRKKYSRPYKFQSGIANPFRGVIIMTEPEDIEITVTMYKVLHLGMNFNN